MIPFLLMRGGTSRGPYFDARNLPSDRAAIEPILRRITGAGHPLNIDGVGGGVAVTTKCAILSRSAEGGVDYLFAQVHPTEGLVDWKPTCGNILSGVGPAAIEMGLIEPQDGETEVTITAVNTGATVRALVQTPGGRVTYEGGTAIDGVPGTAAPIRLAFTGVEGSSTGAMLPTGNMHDIVDGIEVTCMDVAMPIVIARASDLGLTGHESREDLDADRTLFDRIEPIRLEAARLMGMGDAAQSVTPKFAVLAEPRHGGAIAARYFMPWTTHPTMAVTGSQCIAACAVTPGTVADGLATPPSGSPATITIEHASGTIDVLLDYDGGPPVRIHSAGLLRTARLIARCEAP